MPPLPKARKTQASEPKQASDYALDVLTTLNFTAEVYTAEELKEIDIIVGGEIKANKGEKQSLYLSVRNSKNQPLKAIYFSIKAKNKKEIKHDEKGKPYEMPFLYEGKELTSTDVCFYYVSTDKDGNDLEEPYFIAGVYSSDFKPMV